MLWAPKFRKLAKYMHMISISLPTGMPPVECVDGKIIYGGNRLPGSLALLDVIESIVFSLHVKGFTFSCHCCCVERRSKYGYFMLISCVPRLWFGHRRWFRNAHDLIWPISGHAWVHLKSRVPRLHCISSCDIVINLWNWIMVAKNLLL